MKNLVLFLLLAPFMLAADPINNDGNPSLDAIIKALNAGDADGLAKYFADNVEISMLDKEQVYTKAKALEAMRSFFAGNKPKSFAQMHSGQSRENSDQYCIGNLSAASGNFRVYIYLKVSGNSTLIQEMRFDKA